MPRHQHCKVQQVFIKDRKSFIENEDDEDSSRIGVKLVFNQMVYIYSSIWIKRSPQLIFTVINNSKCNKDDTHPMQNERLSANVIGFRLTKVDRHLSFVICTNVLCKHWLLFVKCTYVLCKHWSFVRC